MEQISTLPADKLGFKNNMNLFSKYKIFKYGFQKCKKSVVEKILKPKLRFCKNKIFIRSCKQV